MPGRSVWANWSGRTSACANAWRRYRPQFPERFGSLEDSRAFCYPFFRWYNTEHRHSGIAFLTPADVHYERATQILKIRSATLDAAFEAHPQRFKGKCPCARLLPRAV